MEHPHDDDPAGGGGFDPAFQTTNTLAIVSLVLGIVGLATCCCILIAPIPIGAIICGALSISQINANPQTQKGKPADAEAHDTPAAERHLKRLAQAGGLAGPVGNPDIGKRGNPHTDPSGRCAHKCAKNERYSSEPGHNHTEQNCNQNRDPEDDPILVSDKRVGAFLDGTGDFLHQWRTCIQSLDAVEIDGSKC